jgi:hypothetical protein
MLNTNRRDLGLEQSDADERPAQGRPERCIIRLASEVSGSSLLENPAKFP